MTTKSKQREKNKNNWFADLSSQNKKKKDADDIYDFFAELEKYLKTITKKEK